MNSIPLAMMGSGSDLPSGAVEGCCGDAVDAIAVIAATMAKGVRRTATFSLIISREVWEFSGRPSITMMAALKKAALAQSSEPAARGSRNRYVEDRRHGRFSIDRISLTH